MMQSSVLDAPVGEPVARLRALLARSPFDAVVLTHPSNVAWITRGANTAIDRTSPTDATWLVVRATTIAVVTTNVEIARVLAEFDVPGAATFDIVEVPWFAADYAGAALTYLEQLPSSASADSVASDSEAFGTDISGDLTALRMQLDDVEQVSLIALGYAATFALESALAAWAPGDTDLAVQGDIVGRLEAQGIQTPVVIVGGDERLERFRHPLAVGAAMHRRVMGVVVACRHGLHVAVTRYAEAEPLSAPLVDSLARVRDIEAAVLEAMTPGSTYGAALEQLAEAYAAAGHPDVWREHYQGGPIGFAQREFEIAPIDTASRWFTQQIKVGHAVAFNPSLSGGAKVEDTYLITSAGLLRVTDSSREAGTRHEPHTSNAQRQGITQ